eukprot:6880404-Prymnesium_polylepis.1
MRSAGSHLTALEAHGTGTALGDPIEAGAVAAAVGAAGLVASALKANLGHAEPAAGMAGAIGLLAVVRSACAPPNAQLRVLSAPLVPPLAR